MWVPATLFLGAAALAQLDIPPGPPWGGGLEPDIFEQVEVARSSSNDGNHDSTYFLDGAQVNSKYRLKGGSMSQYDLRSIDVNTTSLRVDSVKQLSGYIQDKANKKNFFYCNFRLPTPVALS